MSGASTRLINSKIFNRAEAYAFYIPVGPPGQKGETGLQGFFGDTGDIGETGTPGVLNELLGGTPAGAGTVTVGLSSLFTSDNGSRTGIRHTQALAGPDSANFSNEGTAWNQMAFIEIQFGGRTRYAPAYWRA